MIYTAAVLNENSAHLLRWLTKALTDLENEGYVFKTTQGEPLPHHMTLNLGTFDESLNKRNVLGGFAELHIDRISFNHNIGICAAPVNKARVETTAFTSSEWVDLNSMNDHPHITTCVKPGVSPKFSNDMLDNATQGTIEVLLDQTYILEGWVKEVKPQKTYTGK